MTAVEYGWRISAHGTALPMVSPRKPTLRHGNAGEPSGRAHTDPSIYGGDVRDHVRKTTKADVSMAMLVPRDGMDSGLLALRFLRRAVAMSQPCFRAPGATDLGGGVLEQEGGGASAGP
jgi:hypothetical protein